LAEVTGVVRGTGGWPIEGVMVMDAGLNYAETDSDGQFRISRPEMALFFWCTGYLPEARVLKSGERQVEVLLRPVAAMRATV
jgi:hypothetical protein